MIREGTPPPESDRERRALLEQLQTELREARAALAMDESAASLAELEAEYARVVPEAEAGAKRIAAMQQELAAAPGELKWLQQELDPKPGTVVPEYPSAAWSVVLAILLLSLAWAVVAGLMRH